MLLKSGRTGATETVESPWYCAPYVPKAFLGLLNFHLCFYYFNLETQKNVSHLMCYIAHGINVTLENLSSFLNK